VFLRLLILYAALLPDLYCWSKSCILYSNFHGTWKYTVVTVLHRHQYQNQQKYLKFLLDFSKVHRILDNVVVVWHLTLVNWNTTHRHRFSLHSCISLASRIRRSLKTTATVNCFFFQIMTCHTTMSGIDDSQMDRTIPTANISLYIYPKNNFFSSIFS